MAWLVEWYNHYNEWYDPGKPNVNRALSRLIGTSTIAPSPSKETKKQNKKQKSILASAEEETSPLPSGWFPNLDQDWPEAAKTVAVIAGVSYIGYSIVKRAAALTFTATVIACGYAVACNPKYRTKDVRVNLVRLFDDTLRKVAVTIGPYLHRVQEESRAIDLRGRVQQLWQSWFPHK